MWSLPVDFGVAGPLVTGKRVGPLQLQLPPPLGQRAQPRRVEPDETLGVALIVSDLVVHEGDAVLIVERDPREPDVP